MAKINRLFRPEQYEREARDFYPAPPRATECLLETVPLRGFVWEPCAGQGAMATGGTEPKTGGGAVDPAPANDRSMLS